MRFALVWGQLLPGHGIRNAASLHKHLGKCTRQHLQCKELSAFLMVIPRSRAHRRVRPRGRRRTCRRRVAVNDDDFSGRRAAGTAPTESLGCMWLHCSKGQRGKELNCQ